MHHLRDALLAPSPKEAPDITKLDDPVVHKQKVRDCIARGGLEEVRAQLSTTEQELSANDTVALGMASTPSKDTSMTCGTCTTSLLDIPHTIRVSTTA
jgi:hypothetical protein